MKIEISNYSNMLNTEIFLKSHLFISKKCFLAAPCSISFLTVDQTHTPTLDHQGSPPNTEF